MAFPQRMHFLAGVYLDCFRVFGRKQGCLEHPWRASGARLGHFLGEAVGGGSLRHGRAHCQPSWLIVTCSTEGCTRGLSVHFPLCHSQGSRERLCHRECLTPCRGRGWPAPPLVWWEAVELSLCLLPRRDSDRQRLSQHTIHTRNLISAVVGWPVDQ